MQAQEDRPPYVTYELRSEEDRSEYVEGQVKFKDVAYAMITPMGSKDRVERKVSDWFPQLKEAVKAGRFKQEWLAAFEAQFKAWQQGQEIPVNGISIRSWPVATPSQVKALLALQVLTVEDLAIANEQTLGRIGMGGRALKQQAVDFLAGAKDLGSLVRRLDGQAAELETLKARNLQLEADNVELGQKVAVLSK